MPEGVSLALLTCDLRVHDSPVLHAAAQHSSGTVPLFVLDEGLLAPVPPNRAAFLADSLQDLDRSLRARGSRLLVLRGDTATETARLAARVGASAVHVAAGVGRTAQRREDALRKLLDPAGVRLEVHEAVTNTVAPGAVLPFGRDHYAVFGAYLRQWSLVPRRRPLPAPHRLPLPQALTDAGTDVGADADFAGLPLAEVTRLLTAAGGAAPDLLPGGESHGRLRLDALTDQGLKVYQDVHDDLPGDSTSKLSPYLHFGCVSATEVALRAAGAAVPGSEPFLRQLAWRDFHHQLLAAHPECTDTDYRSREDRWSTDEEAFGAWCRGRTGYPVVDAGMRQLLHTGWMHNRARLVTAGFLTKTLYQDWRRGAAHFARHLVDADVANNQLNWQWVAGTGTDTRPNRVLNPLRQAQRFDPKGDYVRRWVPELAAVAGPEVHRPWMLPPEILARLDYPAPIIDLHDGLSRFREARGL